MSNTLIGKIYKVLHKTVSFGQHLAKTKTNIAQWLLVSTFLEKNTWLSVNFTCITFTYYCTLKDALLGTRTNYGVSTKYFIHFLTQPHVAQQLHTTTYAMREKSRIVSGLQLFPVASQKQDVLWSILQLLLPRLEGSSQLPSLVHLGQQVWSPLMSLMMSQVMMAWNYSAFQSWLLLTGEKHQKIT